MQKVVDNRSKTFYINNRITIKKDGTYETYNYGISIYNAFDWMRK